MEIPVNELTSRLADLKSQVSKLGLVHLHGRLPIDVTKLFSIMEPFILIEQAFDRAIKKIKTT